jgi:4-aminobutyrate aminotransferase-like enzyme
MRAGSPKSSSVAPPAPSVAGFIAEPIKGGGGFITERIVRTHGGVFISDEVQTGWGRTGGNWFGISMEWYLTS